MKSLPKAELHCHLDGSLRSWTLLELSTAKRIVLPEATPATLADWMR
ncbi:MAG: adenosine deaminase, partial [Alphaproteobacteria bacterium]